MDFNKIPKQFCENVVAGHSQENFVMLMSVGETATAYALTPAHMEATRAEPLAPSRGV